MMFALVPAVVAFWDLIRVEHSPVPQEPRPEQTSPRIAYGRFWNADETPHPSYDHVAQHGQRDRED